MKITGQMWETHRQTFNIRSSTVGFHWSTYSIIDRYFSLIANYGVLLIMVIPSPPLNVINHQKLINHQWSETPQWVEYHTSTFWYCRSANVDPNKQCRCGPVTLANTMPNARFYGRNAATTTPNGRCWLQKTANTNPTTKRKTLMFFSIVPPCPHA